MKHARLSPSNHRWVKCPGSVRMEKDAPNTTNEAAIDGTKTHLLLEESLIQNKRPDEFIGQTLGKGEEQYKVDKQRADRANMCYDYVLEMEKSYSEYHDRVTVQAESRSNPGLLYGRADWYGTADVTIMCFNNDVLSFVHVIDYKDGQVPVNVEVNSQLESYLIGKAGQSTYTVDGVGIGFVPGIVTVVQPKINNPIQSSAYTSDQLKQRAFELITAANATDDPDANLKTGDHCTWCRVKDTCPTLLQQKSGHIQTIESSNVVHMVHENLDTMTDDDLSQILDSETLFIEAFTKAKMEAQRRIESGKEVGTYYMGKGRNSKKWNLTDAQVKKLLKELGLKPSESVVSKVLSPAQALKLELSEEDIEKLKENIMVEEGKPSLKKAEKEEVTSYTLFGS